MASYIFSNRRKDKKSWKWMEFSLMFGIFVFFTFIYFSFIQAKGFGNLMKNPHYLPLVLLLFLLLVYFPARRNMKLQKCASIVMETSRKGLHYKDFQVSQTYSWRDFRDGKITLDVHPSVGVYPREFRLSHSKGKLIIDHDPALHPLEGALSFLEECKGKLSKCQQIFVSFQNFCPYCGADKGEKKRSCACGEEVTYVHKLKKPFLLVREEIAMMVFALILMNFWYLGLIMFILFIAIPVFLTQKNKVKTIDAQIEDAEKAAREAAPEQKAEAGEDSPKEPEKDNEADEEERKEREPGDDEISGEEGSGTHS
jgi:hypothetical protein